MNTDPELKLFVSNIDPAWDEQKIRDLFETYGDLISISQFTDQGRSNLHVDLGCAYVKFAHKSQAEEAAKRIQQNVK